MNLPEKEIEMILNGIRDFILIISPDREILEVNDAFLRHMNYTREDVIGRKCFEVFKEKDREDGNCHQLCPLEEVIRNQKHSQFELTRLDKDDKPRFMEVSIFPIWEKKGKIARFIEISRDVTKRRADEKQAQDRLVKVVEERTRRLQQTHERLLHQDKMASLGRLSSSVVHEINNPVAGILNLVMLSKRILQEDTVSQSEIDMFLKYLDLMETETRRISRIVSNLLVFARNSKIEVGKFDINALIEQTLLLNSNLLKINGIRVIEEFEKNLPLVTASDDQLKQVFMNLISNAAESMTSVSRGKLVIETFSLPEDKSVVIKLKDTGPGMDPEILPKIFEPFYTTKKKGKGVGLGLSVVYGIIKDHGGKIEVDSAPGQGTEFRIKLFQEMNPGNGNNPTGINQSIGP